MGGQKKVIVHKGVSSVWRAPQESYTIIEWAAIYIQVQSQVHLQVLERGIWLLLQQLMIVHKKPTRVTSMFFWSFRRSMRAEGAEQKTRHLGWRRKRRKGGVGVRSRGRSGPGSWRAGWRGWKWAGSISGVLESNAFIVRVRKLRLWSQSQ